MVSEVNDRDIEYALQVINYPELEAGAFFQEWIQEKKHQLLLKKLRSLREAGLLELKREEIDLNEMWRQFEHKTGISRQRRIMHWMARVVAAVVILLLAGKLFMPVREPEVVLLQKEYRLGKGVTLVAEVDPKESGNKFEIKELSGIKTFVQDSLRGISYSTMDRKKEEEMKYHTLRVPRAADYMVILEDSTCVWVNAESELHYPARFGNKERIVELKGEAYFKVHRDVKRPFIVRTALAETRVLGTEFNMQAYPARQLNVTLVSGRIGVKAEGQQLTLQPGQNVTLAGGKLKLEDVDVLKYVSWKDGFFYYDNARLEDILEELGRWYDFNISFKNMALKELRFKFWAGRYESFERILMHLKETEKVSLKVEDQCVIVDNYHRE